MADLDADECVVGMNGVGNALERERHIRVVKPDLLEVGHPVVAGHNALPQGDEGCAAGGQSLIKGDALLGIAPLGIQLHDGHGAGDNAVL